jgi:hypothetical protein
MPDSEYNDCWGSRIVTMSKVSDAEAGRYLTDNRARDVRRTEVGLFLIVIGFVPTIFFGLFWFYRLFDYFPVIEDLGLVLSVPGLALIVPGRKPFGPKHSNYAILSVSITALFNLLLYTGSFSFTLPIVPPGSVEITLTAFPGVSALLLTYVLQGVVGRILLWAAFVYSIVWAVTLVYEGWKGPLSFLLGPISILLTLASSGIFTVAYYLAYSRVRRKVIPASLSIAEAILTSTVQ